MTAYREAALECAGKWFVVGGLTGYSIEHGWFWRICKIWCWPFGKGRERAEQRALLIVEAVNEYGRKRAHLTPERGAHLTQEGGEG